MAAWRLNLNTSTCRRSVSSSPEEVGELTELLELPETSGNNVGTQTDLSFPITRSNKQDWVFFEPRKNLQGVN
ncbi:hypothetical protein DPMN_107233 [Dreissena polymorpha]|uniref:Uncharacterized protein n=1 Tax=Dreissena polymorpha TaxID=45954 RepID=A0A9D4K6C6_DREPO|nr:hypothetical protein DPMN_107233 [Dreissena polymorpha]